MLIDEKCQWVYFYLAVDKEGQTVDFMLSEQQINGRQIKYLNNIVEQDHRFIKK